MLRLNVYFDFNIPNYNTIRNINQALNSFVHKDKVNLTFRSYPLNSDTHLYHQIYHFGRKEGLGIIFLLDIFDLCFDKTNLDGKLFNLSIKYNFDIDKLDEVINTNKYLNIIKNQQEYAGLLNVKIIPSLIFSHGFKLEGECTQKEIKDTLIKVYEKDSGIEYCEDDCDR